jgi:hypothetical protein
MLRQMQNILHTIHIYTIIYNPKKLDYSRNIAKPKINRSRYRLSNDESLSLSQLGFKPPIHPLNE